MSMKMRKCFVMSEYLTKAVIASSRSVAEIVSKMFVLVVNFPTCGSVRGVKVHDSILMWDVVLKPIAII